MRRVTVSRVRDAYRKRSRYPISGVFRDNDGGCCPLTVVASAEGHRVQLRYPNDSLYIIRLAEALGVTELYVRSFIDAYDGIHDFHPSRHLTMGFKDGFRVRNEVPPEKEYA